MPRLAREPVEGSTYHAVARGITRQILFEDDLDRRRYLDLLFDAAAREAVEVHAYCLMDDHVHLLLRGELAQIGRLMKAANGLFARYFNVKYDRTGPLFQGRYHSEGIRGDEQYLAAFRYILQNPEKAGLAATGAYRWSSFGDIAGNNEPRTSTDLAIGIAGSTQALLGFITTPSRDSFADVPSTPTHSDDALRAFIANELQVSASTLAELPKKKRNACLRQLKAAGFTIKRIERVTGIGRGIVQRA